MNTKTVEQMSGTSRRRRLPQNDRRPWNVRALLEATATPFAIADYGPRAAISKVTRATA